MLHNCTNNIQASGIRKATTLQDTVGTNHTSYNEDSKRYYSTKFKLNLCTDVACIHVVDLRLLHVHSTIANIQL